MIADIEPSGTGREMPSTYAEKFGDDHRRVQMTFQVPPAPAAPRTTSPAAAPAERTTKATAFSRFEARDGAVRIGAISPLDSSNRVSAKRGLAALGWNSSTELVADFEGGTAVIREGRPTRQQFWLHATHVDDAGRLRLPPDVRKALGLTAGDQVIATALPEHCEMHLAAAADILQWQTGTPPALEEPDTPTDPDGAADQVGPKSRVRVKRALYSA